MEVPALYFSFSVVIKILCVWWNCTNYRTRHEDSTTEGLSSQLTGKPLMYSPQVTLSLNLKIADAKFHYIPVKHRTTTVENHV